MLFHWERASLDKIDWSILGEIYLSHRSAPPSRALKLKRKPCIFRWENTLMTLAAVDVKHKKPHVCHKCICQKCICICNQIHIYTHMHLCSMRCLLVLMPVYVFAIILVSVCLTLRAAEEKSSSLDGGSCKSFLVGLTPQTVQLGDLKRGSTSHKTHKTVQKS